ncbi:MAG: hypothetical protein DRP56_00415 [Planctomycetota bacterium]|nr:MAG: hypothetical protein DRP56_00415 [Planctomycetota bacterium]
MKKIVTILFLMAGCILFSGCGSEQQVVSDEPVCLSNTLTDQAMEAAQAVLLKMHFDIEKYDTQARYIRTRPLSGAQFFEIWRQDNASASSAAQANLHTLRRVVELDFTPQNTTTCIQCRAQVLRLSIPERPIEGASRMGGAFTESSSRYQTLEVDQHKQAQIEWIDAGTDHDLEQKILKLIQRNIEKGAAQ